MSAQDQAFLNVFGVFFNGIGLFAVLLILSYAALALSVNSSAKARNVANRPLFFAATLLGGVPVAIMYSCAKKKLTRTDVVKPSAAKLWLTISIILAALSIVVYVAAYFFYIFGLTSVVVY